MGYQVYDLLLHVRPNRQRIDNLIFLNVDDNAIAYNGVFPWPRSIMADALLRLKEFGAKAVIFDIEYIDRGPQGIDAVYMNLGLPADFNRSFSEINSAALDIFSALASGRLNLEYLDEFAAAFSGLVSSEQYSLLNRVRNIARDNDEYLIQASALFGRSWVTLNLRHEPLLHYEHIKRRPIAEERFSYPVIAHKNAYKGRYVDILPTIPGFALAAKGAGFTNSEIDMDGIRRRIDLAQNVHGHWYLQLAFAPLMHYFGNPQIELSRHRLLIRNANMPCGATRDISVPLDGQGRMLLDWPREDYFNSFEHISFYQFSLLEDLETELELFSRAFGGADIRFFARFDPALQRIPFITGELARLFDAIHFYRARALQYACEEYFNVFVDFRSRSRGLIRELLDIDPAARLKDIVPDLVKAFPDAAFLICDEADYISSLAGILELNLNRYETIRAEIDAAVRDRFAVIGRVDTGTTDIGSNPFHAEYINAGTHGVVLDMILSGVFLTPVPAVWRMLFTVFFVFLFFIFTGKIAPVPRIVSGFLITVFVIAVSAVLFRFSGIFFNPLLPVLAMVSAVILREIISYADSEREKQFIRKAFSTYVSHEVVKEILADPSRLQLGGTKRYMTTLFTDVKGFSTISEQMTAEGLVSLLNRYLTVMSNAILEEGGTIDKYVGDAIVAFFGAPVQMPDHAMRACVSAIAMKRLEAQLNKKIMDEKFSPLPVLTRIGINSGDMVAGNMGTETKMNYTIMGNAANIAARLEGVNKQYGTWILASDDTVRQTEGRLLTRKLDRVRVVGINEPVRIHEILDLKEAADTEKLKLVEIFHEALDCYENRNWEMAMQGFRESYSIELGGPSAIYIERCKTYLINPPKDNWDGVHSIMEKKM